MDETSYMGYEIRPADVDYAQFRNAVLVRLPGGEEEPFVSEEEAKSFIRLQVQSRSLNMALEGIFGPTVFGRAEEL